jgi:hypothetical protein
MASHTISFTVSGETITNNNSVEDVASGDTVTFTSNATVYVKFDSGQWPFTQAQPANRTITVSTTAGPYTVANNPDAVDNYEVGLTLGGAAKASGTVDVEPDR